MLVAQDYSIEMACPLFPSRDITASVGFYSALGFRALLQTDEYGIVERDGVALCGSSLEIAGEIAALMSTSTHPDHRRQGAQQAAMVARLRMARSAGCRVATIQSEPGIPTARNARRLGFQVAYTRAVLKRPEMA